MGLRKTVFEVKNSSRCRVRERGKVRVNSAVWRLFDGSFYQVIIARGGMVSDADLEPEKGKKQVLRLGKG
jgi:hypothetical protein